MRVLLMTIGSYGDVLPFVALGKALLRRGHAVTLSTNSYFQSLTESAGLRFVPLGADDLYRKIREHPDMWHPMRGFKVVFGQGVVPLLRPMMQVIEREYIAGETVVAGSSLSIGVPLAEEKFGYCCATVHLQPSIFRSVIDPPKLSGLFLPPWMPHWLKRRIWETGDRYFVDPVIAPSLNQLRSEMNLAPVANVLDRWWHCKKLAIGLFPEWYAPPPADWPPQLRLVGFPLHDVRDDRPITPALRRFLDDGDKPIAFTPGSAMAHGRAFFDAAVKATERLGRRGILLTLHPDQIPASLPPGIIHVDYAPFSELLPRCSAIVHHGGIGTTSQALRAGVPQLIMPLSHDQPDNARRLNRLGVGLTLYPNRFTPRRVAAKLNSLLTNPTIAQSCRQIATRFNDDDAMTKASQLLEKLRDDHRSS